MILHEKNPERTATSGGGSSEAEGLEPLLRSLLAPLGDAVRQLWILAQVRSDRSRIAAARAWRQALAGAAVASACALLALAGLALAALGARGGFRELFAGRPWLADLATGALCLCAALAWSRAHRSSVERAERRRLAARYAALEGRSKTREAPANGPDPAAPRADAAASPGGPAARPLEPAG